MLDMYDSKIGSPLTVLSTDILSTDTEITVSNILIFANSPVPNIATIGCDLGSISETIYYTGYDIGTSKLTGVVRGFQGYTASDWESGVKIGRIYTSYDHTAFKTNILENIDAISTLQEDMATLQGSVATIVETAISTIQSDLSIHIGDTNNPHSVNATQVGKDEAQWNANKINGKSVIGVPIDLQLLQFSEAEDAYVHIDGSNLGGGGNVDGGDAFSIYLDTQLIDGGDASSFIEE